MAGISQLSTLNLSQHTAQLNAKISTSSTNITMKIDETFRRLSMNTSSGTTLDSVTKQAASLAQQKADIDSGIKTLKATYDPLQSLSSLTEKAAGLASDARYLVLSKGTLDIDKERFILSDEDQKQLDSISEQYNSVLDQITVAAKSVGEGKNLLTGDSVVVQTGDGQVTSIYGEDFTAKGLGLQYAGSGEDDTVDFASVWLTGAKDKSELSQYGTNALLEFDMVTPKVDSVVSQADRAAVKAQGMRSTVISGISQLENIDLTASSRAASHADTTRADALRYASLRAEGETTDLSARTQVLMSSDSLSFVSQSMQQVLSLFTR